MLEKIRGVKYPNIEKFNRLWLEKRIRTPLVVFIGGYAGVGKSTVAEQIAKRVKFMSFYPTGFARASAQAFTSKKKNPALYMNTFRLHEFIDNDVSESGFRKECVNLFKMQRNSVVAVLKNCINFIAAEHQNTIIDGNHVCPDLCDALEKNNPGILSFEFYMKVSNPEEHYKMLQGPTHSRVLTEEDFRNARVLHDFLVKEAESKGKDVYEYNVAVEKILKGLDKMLEGVVERYN